MLRIIVRASNQLPMLKYNRSQATALEARIPGESFRGPLTEIFDL